jgi:tetratricopeptide (TPR) repeat protein
VTGSGVRRGTHVVAFALVAFTAAPAHASSCDDLVQAARTHESSGEPDIALRQYNDAVSLDPTCANGWLGLGALRARMGDAAEAERVYSAALSHVPTLTSAIAGRARTRWQLGRAEEAEADMARYAEGSMATDVKGALTALVELASWYASIHRTPAQLATWRRIGTLAHPVDAALDARARTTIEALALVVGPADPVTHPPTALSNEAAAPRHAFVDLLRSVAARLRF